MRISIVFLLLFVGFHRCSTNEFHESGTILFDRSSISSSSNGTYRLSTYEFKCFRQLRMCSTHGWSLRFQFYINSFSSLDRERKSLLFSTGAHEPHGDGMLIYLHQTKNISYLEFALKDFRNDQFAYYWQVEVDVEMNQWIDVVTTIYQRQTSMGNFHQMRIFFDGFFYKETQVENYTEVFIFEYDQIHSKFAIIYGNDSGLAMFDRMIYYERILTDEEIANVSKKMISMGCLTNVDHVEEYLVSSNFEHWQKCRSECYEQKSKVAIYLPSDGQCGCVPSFIEFKEKFQTEKTCSVTNEWQVLVVTRVIDLIDAEVGLEIGMADSTFLTHGRTRVQRNEGVEIIVSVKNERNLASLTVYGDIEGQEQTQGTSNEIYITAGVVNLSWKTEGAKRVQFRADYRRAVNGEMAEYHTVYVDVVYVKTDLPLKFIHFSPNNRDGDTFQNFTVQTFGSIPINCTLNYGDGHRQTNGTNRDQYYTAHFAWNYTRYGQYNVSIRCYNELSDNTTQITRTIRRENVDRNILIVKDVMESSNVVRFYLNSHDDYFFRHVNCLTLKNSFDDDRMKLIWRKNTLEIIPNEPLPTGKYFYQLECDTIPLQPYLVNVQPAVRSLELDASTTTIKSGQSVGFSMILEPNVDLTILFDCGTESTSSPMIFYIEQTIDFSPIFLPNCTYSKPDHYQPFLTVMNRINQENQSIRIDVEPPLSPFQVDVEDRPDANQLTLVTIRALEEVAYEGDFLLTIIENYNEKNQTKIERIKLLPEHNFTESFYIEINSYGRQILHVKGGVDPTIRESQTTFTIGTDITTKPQVFIPNPMALVNEDFLLVDIQWLDGIGFDVQIDFGQEKTVLLRYGQIIHSPINRLVQKNDSHHRFQWKKLNQQRLQVGYKFTKPGTFEIRVTFIQPSTKLLNINVVCPTVTIVEKSINDQSTCFTAEHFQLIAENSNYSQNHNASSVVQLPFNVDHNLEPILTSDCSENDLIYSSYLLHIDPSQWKYSRFQRHSNLINPIYVETFLNDFCQDFGSKSNLIISSSSLFHGYYLFVLTVSRRSFRADFRQYLQPMEIVPSDLISSFGGNQTIKKGDDEISLNFYSTTTDPDSDEIDRRKLNFTLLCYPHEMQSKLFIPNLLQLGPSRPTEINSQNVNQWTIQWPQLNLLLRRPEIHFQFYEHRCISSNPTQINLQFDSQTKLLNISEQDLSFLNGPLDFLLIVRHLIDGRQLISRLEVDQEINLDFADVEINGLEDAMSNLEDLTVANPRKAVEFVNGLADKLNSMSENSTTGELNETETKTINERMAAMRLKMLSSMDTVLEATKDPAIVDKAIQASATVTANVDQMPLSNQEKSADIIEKVGTKVRDMENADENTVIKLATSLMSVGGNVVQAASKSVSKDIDNDPARVIETLENDVKATAEEESDTKVLYAPTQFYDACDDCDSLPEDRWEEYRQQLDDEKKNIVDGRERTSNLVNRISGGLFTIGGALANRSDSNETQTIESKTMTMALTKAVPDGKSTVSAGDSDILLPDFSDLTSDDESSDVVTKILESKENPYVSKKSKSNIQGSVVTVVLSRSNGSEMAIKNTTKPISIRLTRPLNKRPPYQQQELHGTTFQYHKVSFPDPQMTFSMYVAPSSSLNDTYAVYGSYGSNESLLEPPTESKFDFLFIMPNRTANFRDHEDELRQTIFMPPNVHRGNGTYIFGIKLIHSNTVTNFSDYNSSYLLNMYVSKCQYWDENESAWRSDGCEVGPLTTLESTECLCTHLTAFGGDFYVPPNTIDFKTVFKKFKTLHENAAVFSTVIVIFVIYIIAVIWARRNDKNDLIKWTAAPLTDNLPIDSYHYLLTVHTGVGKESGTTSNVSFVISGESADSGVRKLTDGKIREFPAGSVRNFVMSVETALGPLLYLRVWHDNSGEKEKGSWFLNMINVLDLQTGEKNYFICNNWLAVEKDDGLVDRIIPLASEKELKSFAHLFTQSVKKKFSDGHLWFSVFSRPVRSNFTRVQRVSCCISFLFCTMISNAMFYRQDTQATANKAGILLKIGPVEFTLTQLWISFIGTLIVLPINLIIVTLFRKAKYSQRTLINYQRRTRKHQSKQLANDQKRKKKVTEEKDEGSNTRLSVLPSLEDKTRTLPHWIIYIAWGLVILSILTCSFFIILYSLEWGAKRANEWLITMFLSFGQSVLVIDPLKVFLITALISFLIRRPYSDETLDFNDPFTGTLVSSQSLTDLRNPNIYSDPRVKEIARQRRVRLFNLRPVDSKEMARARQQRLYEIKMGENLREIVVYVAFTVVLIFLSYQSRDTNSNGFYLDTKNLFVTKHFREVKSLPAWWDYCDEVLLKGLYAQTWYNGKNLTWREKLTTGSRLAMRVGAPRIRQLRVKDDSCRVHRRVKHLISHCRDDYNWIDDDTKDYSPRWNFVLNKTGDQNNNETKRCRTPWCYQSSIRTKSGPFSAIYKTYKGGGYVVSLGRTSEKARSILAELRSQNWLDQLTRAVIVDFSLYNANVNLFSAVTLSFEMTSMGSVIKDHQIKIFRLYDHVGSYGVLVYCFEFFFVLFTIYGFIHELLLVIKKRRDYFSQFWNVVSFVTVILSLTAIVMYGMKKTMTRLAVRSLRKSEMGEFVNFNAIASFDEVYSFIVALITFFTTMKFLKLLRFNPRIGMLSKSFRYARNDLRSFGFVFLIFIIAYSQMGFAIFGRSLRSHRNFFASMTTCFRTLLGEIKAPEMFAVSRFYGPLYFVSFIILVFIALLSIFITILNDAFAFIKRQLASARHQNEMTHFMWLTFQKIIGVNNRSQPEDPKNENKNRDETNNENPAPLARFDTEDF